MKNKAPESGTPGPIPRPKEGPVLIPRQSIEARHEFNWMQTHSGKQFFPFAPAVDQICLEDIAHALGMNCRFNGHVKDFYSVAEHCVHSSYLLENISTPEDALWGLLHDSAEAYIADLPKPFKDGIAHVYSPHEERILKVVAQKFGLNYPHSSKVDKVDWAMLVNERKQVMSCQRLLWESCSQYLERYEAAPPYVEIQFWSPREAKKRFIERFHELCYMK